MSNEREAAYKACPETNCDWGAFLRGFQAGAAYQRTQSQPADALVEALENLCSCIMETRGPNADEALFDAREALAAYRAAQEKKV